MELTISIAPQNDICVVIVSISSGILVLPSSPRPTETMSERRLRNVIVSYIPLREVQVAD